MDSTSDSGESRSELWDELKRGQDLSGVPVAVRKLRAGCVRTNHVQAQYVLEAVSWCPYPRRDRNRKESGTFQHRDGTWRSASEAGETRA